MDFLDSYNLKRVLGSGAYGVVTLRKNKHTGHLVACKEFVKPNLIFSWQREVNFLRHLGKHRHIVTMLGSTHFDKRHFIFMEYIELNLDHYIYSLLKPSQRLSRFFIAKIGMALSDALLYCHKKSIIHRDVKPSNIMVDYKLDTIKLIDFGVSGYYNPNVQPTENVGTLHYRAPEILLSARYGADVDVWALACVIAELYCKEPIFCGRNKYDQIGIMLAKLGSPTPTDGSIYNYVSYLYTDVKRKKIRSRPLIENKITMPLSDKTLLTNIFKWNTLDRINLKIVYEHFVRSMTAYSLV